jgi:hypothetical protein
VEDGGRGVEAERLVWGSEGGYGCGRRSASIDSIVRPLCAWREIRPGEGRSSRARADTLVCARCSSETVDERRADRVALALPGTGTVGARRSPRFRTRQGGTPQLPPLSQQGKPVQLNCLLSRRPPAAGNASLPLTR